MKKFFAIIVVVSISVLVFLTAAELLARRFTYQWVAEPGCGQDDPLYHHKAVPESVCRSKTDEWDIVVTHNKLGLRDREFSYEKPAGVKRVLVLGDSFTEGHGVASEATFPKVLEKKLVDSGKKVEVINAGISSYSPSLEYLYLKNEGLKFNPDLVIVEVDLSDYNNDYVYSKVTKYDDSGRPLAVNKAFAQTATPSALPEASATVQPKVAADKALPFVPTDIKVWLQRNSHLYRWASNQIKPLLGLTISPTNPGDPYNDLFAVSRQEKPAAYEELRDRVHQNIDYIAQLLKEKNISFVLSSHPYGHQFSADEWGKGRLMYGFYRGQVYSSRNWEDLEKFAQEKQITYLNLLPKFKESGEKGLYLDYDGHFNNKGHEFTATQLYDFLIQRGLVN